MALLRLKRRRRGRSDGPTKPATVGAPSTASTELALTSSPLPGADELRLAEDDRPAARSNATDMGFDPYSSDAGFAKPHPWERVDRD